MPRNIVAASLVALLVSGCVAEAPVRPSETLTTLLSDDWQYWVAQYPEFATSAGVPGHDARWTDYSPQAIEARNQHLRDTGAKLKAIDRTALDPARRLDYDLYLEMVETAIAGLAWQNDAMPIRAVIPHNLLMPLNQLEGMQQDVPRTIAIMPAASVADYETIVQRLDGIPALVDQHIALMTQGLARGMTPPGITLRDLPGQVAGQILPDPIKSPLLAAFTRFPAAVADADRTRLTTLATTSYAERVKPAFTRLHEFLVKTYLPRCRETTPASALPDGAALYAYNVRWHTTTGRTPKEIHEIGLAEVKRLRAAMDAVMAEVGFKGGFEAFKTHLRTSPAFFVKDAGTLVRNYRNVAKLADPKLAPLFGKLPRTPYGVLAVPDAIAPSQTTAYYEQGAPAAGRPGNMFANTYRLDMRPSWEMEALTLHEAVPGHHLQIALAQELENLPEFRKNTSYTAFVEGWALYAESLGYEMGFYTDPYSKFGQLTYEMWRAVRLVVDTGLHSMGWTRQQAIDFFVENAAKTLQDITVEVDRYIVWPGQALGYKMGQLRIRELRTEAERALGPKFNVRAFHDVVLEQGAVPMDVLAARVSAWIAEAGARAGK